MLYHVYDVWRKFYFLKGAKNLKFSESKFSISGQTCDKATEGRLGEWKEVAWSSG